MVVCGPSFCMILQVHPKKQGCRLMHLSENMGNGVCLEHHWVFVSQFFWWLSRASLYTNFDELWMSALMSDYCYRVSLHTNFDVPWMSVSIVWLLLQELQFVVDRYAEEVKTWRQKEETLLKRINVSSNVSFICYSYSVWVSKWTFLCYISVGSNITFICYTYSVWVSKWTFLCYISVGSNVTFICCTYSVWVSKLTLLCYSRLPLLRPPFSEKGSLIYRMHGNTERKVKRKNTFLKRDCHDERSL